MDISNEEILSNNDPGEELIPVDLQDKFEDVISDSEEEGEKEEEVIEMDGYDLHQVDWSVPDGMRSLEDYIARIHLLYRFSKLGMAKNSTEIRDLCSKAIYQMKNSPKRDPEEVSLSRKKHEEIYLLWDKLTKKELHLLTKKPFTPSKFNLYSNNTNMIYCLLWVIKAVKQIKHDLRENSPLESVKYIQKILEANDIWQVREYVSIFYRKREELLELLEEVKYLYKQEMKSYLKYVDNMKTVPNEMILRTTNLDDWYRTLMWATCQGEWDDLEGLLFRKLTHGEL